MADTPTTRNRLRQPEPGQYNNAWAPVLNSDFGSDRLDEALDGWTSFALSGGTKVLTATNYEADEARMRVIHVTGTGGSVVIPAAECWRVLVNASSGNVVVGNGSASVTVRPGNVVFIASNGVNIWQFSALDLGASLPRSTGVPSLPAHLTTKNYVDAAILAASLSVSLPTAPGIPEWMADPTSARLLAAMLDKTGGGNLVFAEGPVLINPVVGTQDPGDDSEKAASTAYVDAGIDAARSEWEVIDTIPTTSGSAWTFANIPQTYDDLLIEFRGVSHNSGSNQTFRIELSDNGDDWTTAGNGVIVNSTAASSTIYGSVEIPGYRGAAGGALALLSDLSANRAIGSINDVNALSKAWRIAAGVSHIRFSVSGGAGDAGSLVLKAR